MFSFPRAGLVQTGSPGYAFGFEAKSGNSYLFLRKLAAGAQSKVQLVVDISTREVVVRKVSREHLTLPSTPDLTRAPEDREVRILRVLNSLVQNNPPLYEGQVLIPRWANCLSHEVHAVPFPHIDPNQPPQLQCLRVSYWSLCNASSVADWARMWRENNVSALFPVSFVARCIAQVCETLHVMYQLGPEAVYHCDLHLANVFVHFDLTGGAGGSVLPEFYVGDFGCARTAREARVDGIALYGGDDGNDTRAAVLDAWENVHPGFDFPSPPAGTAPPGQRRRWDVARFLEGVENLLILAVPAPGAGGLMDLNQPGVSAQAVGLKRLVMMMRFVDDQDQLLAGTNERSRPPYLVEVVREARKLEEMALTVEQGTDAFSTFLTMGRSQAEQVANGKMPFVRSRANGQTPERARASAANYGEENIDGPWTLIESV